MATRFLLQMSIVLLCLTPSAAHSMTLFGPKQQQSVTGQLFKSAKQYVFNNQAHIPFKSAATWVPAGSLMALGSKEPGPRGVVDCVSSLLIAGGFIAISALVAPYAVSFGSKYLHKADSELKKIPVAQRLTLPLWAFSVPYLKSTAYSMVGIGAMQLSLVPARFGGLLAGATLVDNFKGIRDWCKRRN